MRARIGIGFLILAAVAVGYPSLAATPAAGTVDLAHRTISWQSASFTTLNPGGSAACSAASCDEFTLTVAVPPSFWKSAEGGVIVRTEWESETNDWDLYVYDAAGKEVQHSAAGNTSSEQVFVPSMAPGTYRVVMVAFAVTGSSYKGTAKIAQSKVGKGITVPSTMKFSPTTIVDPQFFASEPSIWVHTDGTIYLSGIAGFSNTTSYVWRSRNGGRTFDLLDAHLAPNVADPRHRPCTASGGGGDSDVIVDRTGRVMLSDLQAENLAINWSTDGGDNWQCNTLAASTPEEDRQWLAPSPAADDDGPNIDAYHVYRDLVVGALPVGALVKPIQMHLDVTRDGGATWTAQSVYGKGLISQSGPIFTHRDGTVYQVFEGQNGVYVARSGDEGKTWELKPVSQRLSSPGNQFIGGDVDEAGNLFVAWTEAGSWDVLFSASTDRGEHWTEPVRINPPESETTDFPWVAAGKAGDVAVAWYGAKGAFTPDAGEAGTRWDVWAARSVEGTKAHPTFEVGKLTEIPPHFGAICNSGLACDTTSPGDRSLGDFFEIDIAPDGSLMAVFNDNGRIHNSNGFAGVYVAFVRQTGGLGMAPAAQAKAAVVAADARGDALQPRLSPSGVNVPALDVVDASARYAGDKLEVSFRLGDASSLGDAIAASDGGLATEAYWIATWRAADRLMWAGLHRGSTGGETFFGGNDTGAVTREPDNEKYATYPNTFSLDGTIDPVSGRVTILVPLTDFKFSIDEPIHSLQVFSLTGQTIRTLATALTLYDATPARTWPAAFHPPVVAGTKQRPRPAPLPATGVGSGLGFGLLALAGAGALGASMRRRAG